MKTKRVRIAVAVTSDWDWSAVGYSGNEADLKQAALDTLTSDDDIYHVVWVEADVPIPEAQRDVEVKGEVVNL